MRLVFGPCEFDSGRRMVYRHGRAIPISPKAFQLLELLIDRRPEVIAKTELIERLWPDTFVSDASLHNVVAEIRAALEDPPRTARYIRTVPRFGYAFHGDARPVSMPGTSSPSLSRARLVSSAQEWLLAEGSNLLGRDRDCDVQIDSGTLSRHHANIVVTGRDTTIEDLRSKNGTIVNGQRITASVSLKDGDAIQVGSVTIIYRILERLPSTLTRGV